MYMYLFQSKFKVDLRIMNCNAVHDYDWRNYHIFFVRIYGNSLHDYWLVKIYGNRWEITIYFIIGERLPFFFWNREITILIMKYLKQHEKEKDLYFYEKNLNSIITYYIDFKKAKMLMLTPMIHNGSGQWQISSR